MRHLILTLSLILGLATSVSADEQQLRFAGEKPFAAGDMFSCKMEQDVTIRRVLKGAKLSQNKLQDFIFRLETLEGTDTLWLDFVLEHSFYPGYMRVEILSDSFIAADDLSGGLMYLVGRGFSFVSMDTLGTTIMRAAICDRF